MDSKLTRFLSYLFPIQLSLVILSILPSYSQSVLYPVVSIPVEEMGTQLTNPFMGGLNNPQFSPIDLDGEGFDDLFIFDRTGDKVLTMINTGTPGNPHYTHAPQYEAAFPEMQAWAMIRDFNCDGVPDILCHVNTGMQVYKGEIVDDNLKFTSYSPLVQYISPGNPDTFLVNIWVARDDIPAVVDVDNDGDQDIVSFGLFGSAIEYYQNRAMERNGNCDMIDFIGADYCWGHFQEASLTNSILLGSCKNGQYPSQSSGSGSRHAGSTVLAFDHDNDGDQDLALGDISFNTLVYLENGGDSANANMIWYDSVFPNYNKSVEMPIFPAAFALDADNDGLEDLVVAPNGRNASVTHGNVWFYKNVGSVGNTQFSHQTDSFLVNDMLEFGQSTNVTFFNHNNDSLMDLIIGNYGYYKLGGNEPGRLALLENVGTTTDPEFKLITRNYMNLGSLNLQSLNPTFGDLDGDGDLDMVIGEENGVLHYFKNTAGPGATATFNLTEPNFEGIDVGQFSAPHLADLNADSLLDLVIGRSDGTVAYYQNIGTKSDPMFDGSSANQFFGEISVKVPFLTTGFSDPVIASIDSTGDQFIFVGSQDGKLYQYLIDPDSLLSGSFYLYDNQFGNAYLGSMATIAIGDLNADGEMEFIFGNERGGLNAFSETIWDSASVPPVLGIPIPETVSLVRIYPNPASRLLTVDLLADVAEPAQLVIFNAIGRQVYSDRIQPDKRSKQVDMTGFSNGVYFVQVYVNGRQEVNKLILSK